MASRQPIKEQEDIAVFSKASASTTGKIKMNYKPIFTEEQKNKTQEHKEKHNNLGKTKVGYNFKRNINEGSFPKNVLKFDFDKDRLHPTQKPVLLMEYLIKTYTNEGETVLDNCMGSGTTGVACRNTGRHFIGIEKDEKYFEIAVNRINEN
jgi:site-specific DNA-methyltransferase (adenine-specific)